VRDTPEKAPRVIAGMPANTFDFQAFTRFLFASARDRRFTPDRILLQVQQQGDRLDLIDRLLLRYYGLYVMRERILTIADRLSFLEPQPLWGPGRVDTFNPLKAYFGFPPEQLSPGELIGTTDFPSIWNQGQRRQRDMELHWDGNNKIVEGPGRTDPMNLTKYFMTELPMDDTIGNADMPAIWHLRARDGKPLQWDGSTPLALAVVTDSALGMRARNTPTFRDQMRRLEAWLQEVRAPQFPFEINGDLAGTGKGVFTQHCAVCHAPGPGSRMGTLIDAAEIGTDPNRLDSWTQAGADAANRVRSRLGVNYANMVKTSGYIAVPLEGISLRAPYLHNGSVPTVRDLLEPPERRPVVFYRGYDVLDPVNLGFKQPDEDTIRKGLVFRYDTRKRANGNAGHLYGTALTAVEKEALVEYLKTL
jgi:hypothetical protein